MVDKNAATSVVPMPLKSWSDLGLLIDGRIGKLRRASQHGLYLLLRPNLAPISLRTSSTNTSTASRLAMFPDFAPPMPSQTTAKRQSLSSGQYHRNLDFACRTMPRSVSPQTCITILLFSSFRFLHSFCAAARRRRQCPRPGTAARSRNARALQNRLKFCDRLPGAWPQPALRNGFSGIKLTCAAMPRSFSASSSAWALAVADAVNHGIFKGDPPAGRFKVPPAGVQQRLHRVSPVDWHDGASRFVVRRSAARPTASAAAVSRPAGRFYPPGRRWTG